jgi:23S rRNA (cytosine1962-C5)-methyltransferase
MTERAPKSESFTVRSRLVRTGDRYAVAADKSRGEMAETRFSLLKQEGGRFWLEAEPVTGRTHQIRVHAADRGVPVLGDALYGGGPAPRLCLHARRLEFSHPRTNENVVFEVEPDFSADPAEALRAAFIEPAETNACRFVHGAADGWPDWYVDRLGDFLLSQGEAVPGRDQIRHLKVLLERHGLAGAYHKHWTRHVRGKGAAEISPQWLFGEVAPAEFQARENGVRYALRLGEGYSVGLFLDKRDNRRRFLTGHVAADFELFPGGTRGAGVLNTFAYTCGFSVCAALGGARTTSLDLSRKYLDWGRRNFELNGLKPDEHEFIHGDAMDWMRRLVKKGRRFDAVVLDPPTFSQSKRSGVFKADRNYGELVEAALPLLKSGGVMLASTNATELKPERFLGMARDAVQSANRRILREHYVPQPPDFPVTREEPAHLKTVWLRVE